MTAKLIQFETPEMILLRISRENSRHRVESKDKMLTEKQRQVYRNRVLIAAMMTDALFNQEFEEFERLANCLKGCYLEVQLLASK